MAQLKLPHLLLAVLMFARLIHDYVPKTMLKSFTVLIKDKNKRVSDWDIGISIDRYICFSNLFTKII